MTSYQVHTILPSVYLLGLRCFFLAVGVRSSGGDNESVLEIKYFSVLLLIELKLIIDPLPLLFLPTFTLL